MNKIAKQLIKIAEDLLIADQLIKIASEFEKFTGSEAVLQNKNLKEQIKISKEKIFNKYKGDN